MSLSSHSDTCGPIRRPSGRRRNAESTCRFIESLVASVFGVGAAELRAKSRGRAPAAFARQAAMYLAHVHLGLSSAAVGAYFDRDRSTVAHACARIEDCRDKPRWAPVFECLDRAVEGWEPGFPGERRQP